MTKIKLLSIAVVGLLIINLCIVGFLFLRQPAHPLGGRPPHEPVGPKKMIIDLLHLDKEQAIQYELLIDDHKNTIKQLNDSIRATKDKLYQTLASEHATQKDALVNRLAMLQKEIENTHYDHFLKIRMLCKPEQLENFSELTEELAKFFGSASETPRPARVRP